MADAAADRAASPETAAVAGDVGVRRGREFPVEPDDAALDARGRRAVPRRPVSTG